MKYQSIDGATFEASTPEELIATLRADSWNPEKTLEAYIKATAKAAKMQTGKAHRATSCAALAEDLEASGLLVPMPEPAPVPTPEKAPATA
jgi:hypothetical protein